MHSLRRMTGALVAASCAVTLSCASLTSSHEQENTKVVQQAYENFRTGNLQGVLQSFSTDIEWVLPDVDNVPFAGTRRGREQAARFFALMGEAQEVQEFVPKAFVAQGDKVIALGHSKWRVKSTGKTYEGDWAHVFTLRNGQIVRFQELFDTAAVAAAYRP